MTGPFTATLVVDYPVRVECEPLLIGSAPAAESTKPAAPAQAAPSAKP